MFASVEQSLEISATELQSVAYISTLRTYVEALDGRLRIIAEFPEGSYEITQFAALDDP